MPDLTAIQNAYKQADYATVCELLDEHFGENPTPNYSTIKQTIETYLAQGLMPPHATLQGLKMLINDLKKAAPLTEDEKFKEQKRQQEAEQKCLNSFYKHLLKFPYHPQHQLLPAYFKRVSGLKTHVLLVFGNSKKIDTLPKFELFARHFLPDSIKKGEDTIPPTILNYTQSRFAADSAAIALNFLKHLLGEQDVDDSEIKSVFFTTVKQKLVNATLILPYTIVEAADSKHYDRLSAFIDNYWQPLVEELQKDNGTYKNHALILLVLVEQNAEDKMADFIVLNSNIKQNTFPNRAKMKIDSVSYQTCCSWKDDHYGFFCNYTCSHFENEWEEAYLPVCGTIEGLFEKITPQAIENLHFVDLLKKFKPN